ncbi:zinc-finger protein [Collariella sp. IMI 366227]|nr:zinc-finger protein [Collariella sp. IMI 366227]
MDASFDPPDRFSGNGDGFHRHSQSNGTHLGLDFSSLMHSHFASPQQTSDDASHLPSAGPTYESHDDLCIDRCMGVGLYNGFQQFNHRGGPSSIQARWARDNALSRYDFPMGLGDISMQLRTADLAHSPSNPYQQQQQWYSSQMGSAIPCSDDDCHSMVDSCCDSQCTMTGKCTDVACADTDDACTDQNCPSRSDISVPSEVVSGAAALISINHAPEESHNSFGLQQSGFLPGTVGNIASHLLLVHGNSNSSDCAMPCPLDDPQNFSYCHLPLSTDMSGFGQFNSPSSNDFQMSRNFVECGAEIQDRESFLAHFNSQHRPYFASGMPNLLRASTDSHRSQSVMASTEVMSPPATPLDTSDSGRSSGTPSPLTPLSNSIEMTDAKHDVSAHLRDSSVTSSVEHSIEFGPDDEHRCLWREEGSPAICGLVFPDAEELFKHASETHIKHAQKGIQGFRCGWDDCPRSDVGAAGFPQRSKIERHMQTHIGHKPHICPICNKGFSAKQALTQHMFIHSNEKPLVCNICHKAFRYPSALSKPPPPTTLQPPI